MTEPIGIKLRTEKRTPEQARQQLEKHIIDSGGVRFDFDASLPAIHETGTYHDVERIVAGTAIDEKAVSLPKQPAAVLLEVMKPIAMPGDQGKRATQTYPASRQEPPYVEVVASTQRGLEGKQYKMDLSDAPKELQAAVEVKWKNLLANEASFAGQHLPENIRQEFTDVRTRYDEIIKAMQPTARPDTQAAAVTETKRPISRQDLFVKAFGELPMHIYNATKDEGVFVVEVSPGKFSAAKIKPISGEGGKELIAWQLGFVIGEDLGQAQNQRYRAKLDDMPDHMRRGLQKTAEAKRASGEIDNDLFQASALREQGRQFGKEYHARVKWIADDPATMKVGNDGQLRWKKRPDGKWEVADVLRVPGVNKGVVYLPDLSNAPQRIRTIALQSGMFAMQGKIFADLYSSIPASPDVAISQGQEGAVDEAAK